MNTIFKLLFLFFYILNANTVLAGTIEENRALLNRCDNFYCNGTTNSQVLGIIHSNLAIVVQPQQIQMPQVLIRPRINFQIAPPTQPQNGRVAPQGVTSGSSEVNSNDKVEKSSVPSQNPSQPDSQGGGGGSSVSQFNSPNGANTNSQLKAGLLYSNDEEKSSGNKVETANQSGSALANLAPKMDPVKQNLNNSSSGSDGSGSPYKPTSGTQASDFGNYQSGTPVAATGFIGQIKNELAEIAASMGENFFGDLGGRSGNSRSALAAKAEAAKNAKNKVAQADIDRRNRDLLKRGLAQFGGRGLANHLEFGASNTFLFGNMCKHYINYAEKNNIPNDRSPCPMK